MSLKDIFVVVTLAAAFCWCAAMVGFDNELFWVNAAVVTIAAPVWVAAAGSPRFGWLAVVGSLLGLLIFGGGAGFGSMALFFTFALLTIAGILCMWRCPWRLKYRVMTASLCTLLPFVAAVTFGSAEWRRMAESRRQYPLESLTDRLAYEPRHALPERVLTPALNSPVSADLSAWEKTLDQHNHRRQLLENLHDENFARFVRSAGFGAIRLMSMRPGRLEMPAPEVIKFADEAPPATRPTLESWYQLPVPLGLPSADAVHAISRDDFLHPAGFGWRANSGQVAGFIEHAFHASPTASPEAEDWEIERLELVSLLKFDEPRVYVLDHLPGMDHLASEDIPTRPLDEFESAALSKIHRERDIVVDDSGDAIRMLGSLRAATQCLDCHQVQRGDLLGAFSYNLRRRAPAAIVDDGDDSPHLAPGQ